MTAPRVVVVDDDPDILAMIIEVLRSRGPCQVVQLAADIATVDDIAVSRPDLVVLDLRLAAEEEGWRLFHEVRADASLAATPVILCSGDVRQLRERGAEIGAMPGVSALEKPFSLDELERALAAHLALNEPVRARP